MLATLPLDTTWQITRSPKEAPDRDEQVTIGLEKGVPVSVNGIKLDPVSIGRIAERNRRPQRHWTHRSGRKPFCRNEVARLL